LKKRFKLEKKEIQTGGGEGNIKKGKTQREGKAGQTKQRKFSWHPETEYFQRSSQQPTGRNRIYYSKRDH